MLNSTKPQQILGLSPMPAQASVPASYLTYSPSYASLPKRSNNTTPKRKEHVPDAWDDDEDEAGDDEDKLEREVDNATLWRDADARQPMPEVILTASSGSSAAAFPPAAALQQPIRILKRPSAPSSTSGTPSLADVGPGSATLKGRQAEYQAARARIFGLDSTVSGAVNSGSANNGPSAGIEGVNRLSDLPATQTRIKSTASTPGSNTSSTSKPIILPSATSTAILRNPRGPPTSSSETSASTNPAQKGFNRRRNGGANGGRRSHNNSGSQSTTTS
ncbi:uncharacterized protein FOMMEDRAFT_26270 [Fomitiporia mediterranea MF3/22]|uniref:uncharacterized protein n=1 Tax=Fomitiporia mediterranea (strain MF3/22) TaxID=694068 RepID=UPI0004407F0A|nr:uncharacterized protein FOMMEDRAFT_26270 [Fomitiporia mediterranea MF3/22]EJD05312.1 hypothetical protein FOMMEDRAFT_26270 [Fomitiporia mediterranea MF3/22]